MAHKDTFDTGMLHRQYASPWPGQVSASDTFVQGGMFYCWTHLMRFLCKRPPHPFPKDGVKFFATFPSSTETLVVNGILFVLLLEGLMVSLWGERSKLNSADSHLSDKNQEALCNQWPRPGEAPWGTSRSWWHRMRGHTRDNGISLSMIQPRAGLSSWRRVGGGKWG